MRIPNPKAVTTTEAYLAYKAEVLEQSELKDKLYHPYLHIDGWLAYWTGLTTTYPNKGPGKNLITFGYSSTTSGGLVLTCDGNTLTAKGTFTLSKNERFFDNGNVELDTHLPAGTYTASMNAPTTKPLLLSIRRVENGSTVASKSFRIAAGQSSVTATTDFIATHYRASIQDLVQGESVDASFVNIQLEAGSTATSYEPYSPIPECLTDEEAYIAYLSGVTSEYPEALKDPADVRVASYLRYLISARFGRPDYPVTREEFYLSMMKPRFIPSGDPSSEIELDGTVEAPFVDLKMYGDSFQQTYSGKNILTGNYQAGTNRGITYSWDNVFVTLSGTATSTYSDIVDQINMPLQEGTYTFSINKTVQFRVNLRVLYGGSSHDVRIPAGDTSATVTIPSGVTDATLVRPYIDMISVGTVVSDTFGMMLEVGSAVSSFEPYVGGTSAPNPDYPQDIDVVTGRQEVGVSGKNLIPYPYYDSTTTSEGITYTVNSDGTLTINGTWADAGTVSSFLLFNTANTLTLPAGTYYMPDQPSKITMVLYDGTIWRNFSASNGYKLTLTEETPVRMLYLQVNQASPIKSFDDVVFYPMITTMANPTIADYEPYQSQSYEINLGKNLFELETASRASSGITAETNAATGITVLNGTASSIAASAMNNNFIVEIKKGQTYTLSANNKVANSNVRLTLYAGNGIYPFALDLNTANATYTFTASADYICRPQWRVNSGTTLNNFEIMAMLELGDTATQYAPYFEPIELCKIGEYQDYIYRDADGDWYVHKAVGKYTFDGTERWSSGGYGVNSWISTNVILTEFDSSKLQVVSNIFRGCSNDDRSTAGDNIIYSTARATMWIRNTTLTSLEQVHSATNGNYIYYALATPTDAQITNSELIAQLDALMEGGSYNGKTYIKVTATDPNLPGLLYVEAAI